MYNVGARYEIIGRIMDGTFVVGYVLRDRGTNSTTTMEKKAVEQLALYKMIYNCYAQVYNNIVNLKGIGCKLSQLPRYDKTGKNIIEREENKKIRYEADVEIIGKVQTGRKITLYIVKHIPTNSVAKVNKDKVYELARMGRIINAKCQMCGSEMILRANKGYSLADIKTYKAEEQV